MPSTARGPYLFVDPFERRHVHRRLGHPDIPCSDPERAGDRAPTSPSPPARHGRGISRCEVSVDHTVDGFDLEFGVDDITPAGSLDTTPGTRTDGDL